MEFSMRHLEYAVLMLGVLSAAGIIYESMSLSELPTGYSVGSHAVCCSDCSCPSKESCMACGCAWMGSCKDLTTHMRSEGVKTFHRRAVPDADSFTLNVVVLSAQDDRILLDLDLPNGFSADPGKQLVVDLEAGEPKLVPFEVYVQEHVAEQDHMIVAKIVDTDWSTVTSYDSLIRVYWEE